MVQRRELPSVVAVGLPEHVPPFLSPIAVKYVILFALICDLNRVYIDDT